MVTGWRRRVASAALMVVGTAVVLSGVVVMNKKGWEAPAPGVAREVSFDVAPPKPPQKKKEKPRQRKRRDTQRTAPAALIPTAGGHGPAFDLPGLSNDWFADELGDLADRAGGGAVSEDALDKLPSPVRKVAPEYPARARARNQAGQVKLTFLVGLDGRVSQARVLEASPPGVFDAAAVAAIAQWGFEPGEYDGQPVASRMTLTLRFELE